jgi:hypothetical protein
MWYLYVNQGYLYCTIPVCVKCRKPAYALLYITFLEKNAMEKANLLPTFITTVKVGKKIDSTFSSAKPRITSYQEFAPNNRSQHIHTWETSAFGRIARH